MGRGAVSSVHEGGGDLGQEPKGTQVMGHFLPLDTFLHRQPSVVPLSLPSYDYHIHLILPLPGIHQIPFLCISSVLLGTQSMGSDQPKMGSKVKGSINIFDCPASGF